jgi:hypothetical protein
LGTMCSAESSPSGVTVLLIYLAGVALVLAPYAARGRVRRSATLVDDAPEQAAPRDLETLQVRAMAFLGIAFTGLLVFVMPALVVASPLH